MRDPPGITIDRDIPMQPRHTKGAACLGQGARQGTPHRCGPKPGRGTRCRQDCPGVPQPGGHIRSFLVSTIPETQMNRWKRLHLHLSAFPPAYGTLPSMVEVDRETTIEER